MQWAKRLLSTQQELNRRRPGQSILTTARKEADKVEFLSGIFEGKSTGCPIAVSYTHLKVRSSS